MAVGISMVIDDKFLERLSAADTKLEELAKKSEDVRGRVIQSFKSMGDDGVGYFIQKINEAKTALEGLAKGSGKITIDAKGIEVVGTSATKSADDVNKLVQVVDTLAKLNEKLASKQPKAKSSTEEVDTLKRIEGEYNSLFNKLEEYRRRLRELNAEQRNAIQTGNFRQGLGQDIANTTRETEQLMARMSALRSVIDGLGKGNDGFLQMAKSIGSTSSELAAMNKHYAEIERSQAKSSEAADRAKSKNEEQNKQVIANSEAQKKAFEERVKVWERGFDRYDKMLQEQDKKEAAIRAKQAKDYEQAYLKADDNLVKSSERRMQQVLEQINREEVARRKMIESQQQQTTKAPQRTTTSYMAEYEYNAKQIRELEANMQKLIASTKQYETIKSRIDSGKGGVLTKQQIEEYNANIKNIDAIKKQITAYQDRNQTIVNENQAIQAQIRYKQELQTISAKDRESAEILARMRDYYKQQADEAERLARAKNTSYSGAMAYSSNAKTYIEEKQAIEYLTTARNNLSKADTDFANKRNALNEAINKHTESLKRSGMTDSEIAEESAKASEKRRQAALKEAEAYERRKKAVMNKWYSSSADRALNYSANTKSINEQTQAIKYLQIARANLSKGTMTEEEYRKKVMQITQEIKRQQDAVNNLLGANNNLASSHRNLMDISGQLARKMALVFSVSQIQGYVSKLIAVRGEFELQQKSLQVLLQNKDEANKLWQQTVELAVKSPFRVSELVSYTRQLAAYRIETSKLHETTKKLADVSAGLGVDMNRLILAYGQVRAAEYLRGTELRQFTEAGIPMLDELAKRFTQLEGRAVSAGDVFERISKRLVSFKDVAAVFDTMTSAGGTFYRMQEEQSETLKGMISNLRDSFDLMMNDIGKSNEGLLKGTVSTLRKLVENWETIADILKVVISLIAVYRMGMLLTSKTMIEAAVAANITNNSLAKQITTIQLAKLGWKRLGESIAATGAVWKASLPFLAASVVIGGVFQLISVLREHSKQIEEINEKYAKLRDRLQELSYAFNSAVDEKDIDNQKKQLSSLIDMANNEYHMKIKVDLTGATEEDVQKKFAELQAQLTGVNAYANLFEKAMQKSTEWNWSDIFDKTKEMSEAMRSAYSTLAANVASDVNGLRENFDKLSESEKEAFDILKQPKKVDESDVDYLKRLNKGYALLIKDAKEAIKTRDQYSTQSKEYRVENAKVLEIWDRLAKIGISYNEIRKTLAKQDEAQAIAQKEYNEVLEESKELFTSLEKLPEEEKEIRLRASIDKIAAQKGWDEFVKDYVMQWTEQKFNIKFRVVPDEKTPLSAWQESYNKLFDSYYGFDKIEDGETTREKVIQRINGFLKEQKDLVEHIQKAGTGKGTAYEGYDLDEERRKMEELQKQIDWFGISDKKTGDSQNKILNNRISLIKELNKEYEKLNKTMSADESKRRVTEAYTPTFTQAFGGKSISFDFTNLKGVVEQLKRLTPLAAKEGAEAQLALSKAISEVQAEIDVQVSIEDDESIKRRISEMFGSYELSLELDKLNIPHDLAKQLFDIDVFDMDALKANLNDATRGLLDSVYKMAQIENASNAESLSNNEEYLKMKQDIEKRYSQADIDIARDAAKKLMDMEDKARLERLKKYTGYLVAAQSEAVKIKLEEARKIAEIESISEMTPAQKEIAKGAVREETQKQLDKQQWEDFKNTDLYIELFEDLDNVSTNTLNRMKAKLVEIRDSLKNLDPSQLKDIAKRIEKANKALVSKNPFKGMFSSIKNVFTGYNEYKKAAEKALVSQEEVDTQKQVVDNLQLQVEAQKKVVYEKSKSGKASKAEQAVEKTYLSQLENQLAKEQSILNKKREQAKTDEKEMNAKKEILGLSKQQLSEAAKVLDQQLGALNDIKGSWESVFGNMSDGLSDAFDSIQEIGGGISNVISGLSQGPAGYLQAAAGLMQTIGGIFSIGDKKKERQIQREIKKVEDLQHAYEKLEKAIDDAYAIDTLEKSTKNAKANLQAQITSYYKMIAAEEDKKNTDDERIKEWQYAIEDLREQIKELDEQAFNQATGNIIDNVLNAATEFTDAWLEAFKETGNGLTGLEDNFKEAVTNMLKQQASMLITSTYVDKWKKNLEKYINTDDLELTTTEAKQWVEDVKSTLPQLNNALKEYFNAMKGAGIDLGGNYEMSSLQRGLQAMTEDTAQILASYLNSVRFYVAEQNILLQNIAASLGASTIENPMVEQLKIIASQTTAINSLLQSCTKGGHRLGGMGLKIFMD